MNKYILGYLFLSLVTLKASAEVICDDSKIFIERGSTYAWGGQKSFLKTSDPKILIYTGHLPEIEGYLLQTKFKRIEGSFDIVKDDWNKQIPGQSITLKDTGLTQNNFKIVELTIRKNPLIGCIKYRVISGCYAGDDCVQECVSRINIPEQKYLTKKILCQEIGK